MKIVIITVLLLANCISLYGKYIYEAYPYEPNYDYVSGESEVKKIQEYPLQITCPKCGYIYYYVTIPEFFADEITNPEWFHPASPRIGPYEFSRPWERCPNDGMVPEKVWRDKRAPNGWSGMLHTNKGWMPTRFRPNR